jgi:hypothetical protein
MSPGLIDGLPGKSVFGKKLELSVDCQFPGFLLDFPLADR